MAREEEFNRIKNEIIQVASTIAKTGVSSGGVGTKMCLNYEQLMDVHYIANRVLQCKVELDKVNDKLWLVIVVPKNRELALEDDLEVISEMCWEEE